MRVIVEHILKALCLPKNPEIWEMGWDAPGALFHHLLPRFEVVGE